VSAIIANHVFRPSENVLPDLHVQLVMVISPVTGSRHPHPLEDHSEASQTCWTPKDERLKWKWVFLFFSEAIIII
jgi:hypothetical protein